MTNRNKFFTVPEAAEKFGVDRRTMSRWVASGKIEAIVTPGGHHRILRSVIDALLEQNGFPKTTAGPEKTILVVDDDASVRKTLKRRLTRENYVVATASDGFNAGMQARDLKPDLVILDLMMKAVDGFEVCRTIKSHPSLKDTRILILTGFDTPENRARALREGADDYLSKGGPFKRLLQHVDALLAK